MYNKKLQVVLYKRCFDGIEAMPAMLFYWNGTLVSQMAGCLETDGITAFIQIKEAL